MRSHQILKQMERTFGHNSDEYNVSFLILLELILLSNCLQYKK